MHNSGTTVNTLLMLAGEHGGLKLTANARAALMQRLSGAAARPGAVPAMALPGVGWFPS